MSGSEVFIIGVALVAVGIGALRLGWSRARGRLTTPLGWASVGLGLVLLASRDGAWGLAVGGLVGSTAAFVLVAHAWCSRPAQTAGRPPRSTLRLHEEGRLHLGRRLLTFLLVVPAAMAVSLAAGLAAQALGRAAGWAEADSTALGLFVFPLAWALLAATMMVRTGPLAMLKPLSGTLAASAILFWIAI